MPRRRWARGAGAALAIALGAAALSRAASPEVASGRLEREGDALVAEVTIAAGWHVNAHEPRDAFLIPTTLEVAAPPGARVARVEYPRPVERTLSWGEGPLLLYEGTIRIRAALEHAPASGRYEGRLRYQACDDTRCLAPATLVMVLDDSAAAAPGGGAGDDRVARWMAAWGLGPTLLWVAVLGLALNLTPCVYPMISVTVAFFGGRSDRHREHTLQHALCYVLGICVTFSLLGVGAALTGSLFGAALQRPAVIAGISLLMVLLALSNFGLYQLRLPSVLTQAAGRAVEGAWGAFFMGLTMGIVGAPCIGPVVAALLVYVGSTQSALLGFTLFFVLGLGMGLPYVALALLAGRLRRLPRGGAWLAWVEWLFGFVLLGLALYFATPLLSARAVQLAWALLLVAGGLVLGFRPGIRAPAARWGLRLAGVAVAAFGIAAARPAAERPGIAWTPLSEHALERARAESRPVLIDFQAAWCLPCRKMERTTFRDPTVLDVAQDFTMLQADLTEQDARTEGLMREFGVNGVPTYVLLDADGREARRFEGYVQADAMVGAMRRTLATADRG